MSVRPSGRIGHPGGTHRGADNVRRMNDYTFQVRVPRNYAEAKEALLASVPALHPCFVFQHDPDTSEQRVHCHAYYFHNQIKRKSFAEGLTKALQLNGDYATSSSCSPKDPRPLDLSGAWCYGSKWGRYAPSFMKNISPDIVEQLKAYAVAHKPKEQHTKRQAPTQNHHKNNEDTSLFSIWLKQALADKTLEPHQNNQRHWEHYINKYYISQNKPYPRVADCRRYAASIRDILKIQRFNHDIFHVVMDYVDENSLDRV